MESGGDDAGGGVGELEREMFYTILDSTLTSEEKMTRLSHVIDDNGLDVNVALRNDPTIFSGSFPLLLAVSIGSAELVEFLIGRGADVNQKLECPYFQESVCPTALHQACLDGRFDIVEALADTETTLQPPSAFQPCLDLEPTNSRGQTPYHLAVESGNTDLVVYLVERGSWAQACDSNGNNALHMTTCLAPDRFALDMVDTLIGLGVSIYHRNRLGFTPVKFAVLLGRESSAKMMLSGTSHPRRLQEVGFHQLEAAVVNRQPRAIDSVLRLLTERGSVSGTDESLNMVVLNSGLNAMLGQLLSCTQMRKLIDVNGSLGYTPLYNACASRNTDAIQMLLEAGADPDRPSQRQHVLPLKKTVLQNDLEATKLLLNFGASACHCPGCSPLFRYSSSSGALLGIQDGEMDLLYLALFTDVSLCRLLISGGTCVSDKAVQVITTTGTPEHRILRADLYKAGLHGILKRILELDSTSELDSTEEESGLGESLLSPPPLQLLCRTVFRQTVKPRIYWAVKRLCLPQSVKQYLLLET